MGQQAEVVGLGLDIEIDGSQGDCINLLLQAEWDGPRKIASVGAGLELRSRKRCTSGVAPPICSRMALCSSGVSRPSAFAA